MTPMQEAIIRCCKAVTGKRWAAFSDIAETMRLLGWKNCGPRQVSNALNAYTEPIVASNGRGTLETYGLWGHIRNIEGYVVWSRQPDGEGPRGSKWITDPANPSNQAYVQDGGTVNRGGQAMAWNRISPSQLARDLRASN